MTTTLRVVPLTQEAFAPYGDVIELQSHGEANNWDSDVMDIVVGTDGQAKLSLFHCRQPATLPISVPKLEYHPLGSQAFIPHNRARFVVVVGEPGEQPDMGRLKAFVSSGTQGINYRPGVWHTSLPSLDEATYLVVARKGPGDNCHVVQLGSDELIIE